MNRCPAGIVSPCGHFSTNGLVYSPNGPKIQSEKPVQTEMSNGKGAKTSGYPYL